MFSLTKDSTPVSEQHYVIYTYTVDGGVFFQSAVETNEEEREDYLVAQLIKTQNMASASLGQEKKSGALQGQG